MEPIFFNMVHKVLNDVIQPTLPSSPAPASEFCSLSVSVPIIYIIMPRPPHPAPIFSVKRWCYFIFPYQFKCYLLRALSWPPGVKSVPLTYLS